MTETVLSDMEDAQAATCCRSQAFRSQQPYRSRHPACPGGSGTNAALLSLEQHQSGIHVVDDVCLDA